MQSVIDILGSIILGGMILLIVLGFNSNIIESAATQTFHTTTQQNLTTIADIVENDFRKIGYHVSDSVKVTYTDSIEIKFQSDIFNDSTIHTIRYYFNPTASSGHQNPNTRVLYRSIDNGPFLSMNLGLTGFRLWYYDANGSLLTGNGSSTLSKIRAIKISMNIQSTSAFNQSYSGAYWERTIKPKNLK
jgi:hypothetical protein